MRECDERSKEIQKNLLDEIVDSICHIGDTMLMHRGQLVDKAVNTLIREIDAKKCEESYAASKVPEYSE